MKIKRASIWVVNLDPVIGNEINKTRPAIVLSRTDYNEVAGTVTIVPISTGRYISSFHVYIKGLKEESHAVIPQIRVASKKRLIKKIGDISLLELTELTEKISHYLEL